jgi:hypothetical protein
MEASQSKARTTPVGLALAQVLSRLVRPTDQPRVLLKGVVRHAARELLQELGGEGAAVLLAKPDNQLGKFLRGMLDVMVGGEKKVDYRATCEDLTSKQVLNPSPQSVPGYLKAHAAQQSKKWEDWMREDLMRVPRKCYVHNEQGATKWSACLYTFLVTTVQLHGQPLIDFSPRSSRMRLLGTSGIGASSTVRRRLRLRAHA